MIWRDTVYLLEKKNWNWTCSYIQTAVSEHFLNNNHSVSHMLLIPIEKLNNERDSFSKARKAHLIQKDKTIEPLGINKREEQ